MKISLRFLSAATIIFSFFLPLVVSIDVASAAEDIDTRYLQTCLKEEGSSLDVLVLMDSSKSLRDATPQEGKWKGSDPDNLRGPLLKSSLKLLRSLAESSKREFRVNLRNFGRNSNPDELKKLKEKWVDWSQKTSDEDLKDFVNRSLFNDSPGTEWASGIATARSAFAERLGQAELSEKKKSCPIMFWITDGGPEPAAEQQKNSICSTGNASSIDWFRENNILVLGGLLRPRDGSDRDRAGVFRPIVEGKNCGRSDEAWTSGSVIEADDISALAWKFVGLIANIKNLINLGANNSTFIVDPGTSQIEIYIRGNPNQWQVSTPDGSVFCTSTQTNDRCISKVDSEIGITTIAVYPNTPAKAGGTWKVTPNIETEKILVYGGIDTAPPAFSAKLEITPGQTGDIDEGKTADFTATLKNSDGSNFLLDGYRSATICASLRSKREPVCKTGSSVANIQISPSTTDKTVTFQAVLVSEKDSSREYQVSASQVINVVASRNYPSLLCKVKSDPCKLSNMANKNKPAISELQVVAPEVSGSDGKIFLVGYVILEDRVQTRGDGNFVFEVTKANGELVRWNDKGQLLSPGENLNLKVSTQEGGKSPIKGIIKYAVVSEGKEVARQLKFEFQVSEAKNWLSLFLLFLFTYLLTLGLPYLFLLASAKRAAVLAVPDNEFAYSTMPFKFTPQGKIVSINSEGGTDGALTPPSHRNLSSQVVESGQRSIQIGQALIEVIPPRWNAFSNAITRVTLEGHHILTTAGESKFQANQATFTKNLVNESIIYFATDENLAPTLTSKIQDENEVGKGSLFEPSYESFIKQELINSSREITGHVLYFVPFMTNKKKALNELNSRIITAVEVAQVKDSIAELRDEYLARAIAAKDAESAETVKSKPPLLSKEDAKQPANNQTKDVDSSAAKGLFEEDETNQSDLWGETNDSSDSESSRKLWD